MQVCIHVNLINVNMEENVLSKKEYIDCIQKNLQFIGGFGLVRFPYTDSLFQNMERMLKWPSGSIEHLWLYLREDKVRIRALRRFWSGEEQERTSLLDVMSRDDLRKLSCVTEPLFKQLVQDYDHECFFYPLSFYNMELNRKYGFPVYDPACFDICTKLYRKEWLYFENDDVRRNLMSEGYARKIFDFEWSRDEFRNSYKNLSPEEKRFFNSLYPEAGQVLSRPADTGEAILNCSIPQKRERLSRFVALAQEVGLPFDSYSDVFQREFENRNHGDYLGKLHEVSDGFYVKKELMDSIRSLCQETALETCLASIFEKGEPMEIYDPNVSLLLELYGAMEDDKREFIRKDLCDDYVLLLEGVDLLRDVLRDGPERHRQRYEEYNRKNIESCTFRYMISEGKADDIKKFLHDLRQKCGLPEEKSVEIFAEAQVRKNREKECSLLREHMKTLDDTNRNLESHLRGMKY